MADGKLIMKYYPHCGKNEELPRLTKVEKGKLLAELRVAHGKIREAKGSGNAQTEREELVRVCAELVDRHPKLVLWFYLGDKSCKRDFEHLIGVAKYSDQMRSSQFLEARRICTSLLSQFPIDLHMRRDILTKRGIAKAEAGAITESLEDFREALEVSETPYEIASSAQDIAEMLFVIATSGRTDNRGKLIEALGFAQFAFSHDPSTYGRKEVLASIFDRLGMTKQAEKAMAKSAEFDIRRDVDFGETSENPL